MSKVIVIYAGGFQPFHVGHLSSYLQAKKAFPEADFYVAASADTKVRPIPFDVKQFLAIQAGVTPDDFPDIVVRSPIKPDEILSHYNPETDIFVLIRSERDPVGYTRKDGTPGYYQPFVSLAKCESFAKHGYVFVTKKQTFVLNGQEVYSGTQVRDMYAKADPAARVTLVKQLYPKSAQQGKIKALLDKYIGETLAENILSLIKKMRPMIKESNLQQKAKMAQLLETAYSRIKEEKEHHDGEHHTDHHADDLKTFNDPEIMNILNYAKQHYPNSASLQQAFVKFVVRSLKHAKEDDNEQNAELQQHQHEINDLKAQFDRFKHEIGNSKVVVGKSEPVAEHRDYIEEK